jgi:hypothetical protein
VLTGPLASDGSGGLWLTASNAADTSLVLHYAGGKWTTDTLPTSGGNFGTAVLKFGP